MSSATPATHWQDHWREWAQQWALVPRKPVRSFTLRGKPLPYLQRPVLMGVINLSTDSWYPESICRGEAEAIVRGLRLLSEGAEIIDVGAESTLPHAQRVSPQEQIERIVPVVRRLAACGALISVESCHPAVLEAAAQAGAAVFNLTGHSQEADVYRLAARFEVALVHCYVQGETVRDVGDFTFFEDMNKAMRSDFAERIAQAERLGVERHIIDPGLGFYYANLQDGALRVKHQLHTLLHTMHLQQLGWPTLNILPHSPETFGKRHRRAAEPFFSVLAMLGGSHFIRTHEVDRVRRVRETLGLYF